MHNYLNKININGHKILGDLYINLINPKTNNPYSIVVFVGENGCGKTTLLRIVGGFLEPSGGQVIFDGQDIAKLPQLLLRNTNFPLFFL